MDDTLRTTDLYYRRIRRLGETKREKERRKGERLLLGNNLNKYSFVKDGGMSIEFKKFTVTI